MEETRFDWPAIGRVVLIIALIPTIYAFAVPPALGLALGLPKTGPIAGNEIYRWLYWALAWGLMVWQGAWMLRVVGHDRIIDDMLVVSAVVGIILVIVKFVVWIVYEPTNAAGNNLFALTFIDVAGVIVLFLIGLVGARVNRF